MASAFFRSFHARYDASGLRGMFTPRKPRNAALRVLLGLVGVAILAALLVVGLFVGAAMLTAGLAWRMLRRRGGQAGTAGQERVVDAEYRVIDRQRLPKPH